MNWFIWKKRRNRVMGSRGKKPAHTEWTGAPCHDLTSGKTTPISWEGWRSKALGPREGSPHRGDSKCKGQEVGKESMCLKRKQINGTGYLAGQGEMQMEIQIQSRFSRALDALLGSLEFILRAQRWEIFGEQKLNSNV